MSDNPGPHALKAQSTNQAGRCDRVLRLIRRCVVVSLVTWLLSIGLLLGQHWVGVLHPVVVLFVLLLVATLLASLFGIIAGLWRMIRGPRCRTIVVGTLACLVPTAAWVGLSIFTLRLLSVGQSFPKSIVSDIAMMASDTVMEGQVLLTYPHRLESQRLVMFYDDRVTNPQADLAAMEQHVANLETLTGKPLRAKIHWVRGEVFGVRNMSIRGLALGSSQSPKSWETADHPDSLSVDRHELAHAVVHQLQPLDADPPILLIEGWAEAQSGVTFSKRAEWALESRTLWRERTGADETASYLRELTGDEWYRRIAGPVYNVGGAFAQFILEKYGTDRFLRWYFACRPGHVDDTCREHLGVEFDALEAAFWNQTERAVSRMATTDE